MLIANELLQIDQYFIHLFVCMMIGLEINKLYERLNHEMERRDSALRDWLIKRIFVLEGGPCNEPSVATC